MNDLIEKLRAIAAKIDRSDTVAIEAAIDRINKLEAKLSGYEDDITDWKTSVERQMKRRSDDK